MKTWRVVYRSGEMADVDAPSAKAARQDPEIVAEARQEGGIEKVRPVRPNDGPAALASLLRF